MFAFPAGYDVRFGENVFSHFALKVIHLFWTSFFETQSRCALLELRVQRTGHGFKNQTDLDLNLSSAAFQGCWLQVQFPPSLGLDKMKSKSLT